MSSWSRGPAAVRSAAGIVRAQLEAKESTRQLVRRATLRRWASRLVSTGLVDVEYVQAQTRSEFKSAAHAARFVLTSRPSQGISPHPLIEPAWMERGVAPNSSLVIPHWCSVLFGGRLVSTSPAFDAVRWAETRGSDPDSTAEALQSFLAESDVRAPFPMVLWGAGPKVPPEMTRAEVARRALAHAHRFALQDARSLWRPATRWDPAEEARAMQPLDARPSRGEAGSPAVSIIMPVFNRAGMVEDAIRSVQRQTLQDWELIVVDDGSTDRSVEVVAALAAKDDRIVPVLQANSGVSAARNAGLDRASANLIAFLDSDNQWTPRFLSRMVTSMSSGIAVGAYSAVEALTDSGSFEYLGRSGDREDLLDGRNFVDMNALVARRDVLRKVGGFSDDLRRWVDYDLVLRLAAQGPLEYVPFIGVHYDHRSSGAPRITTSQPSAWRNLVLERALVDWQAVDSQLDQRVPDRVSVLLYSTRGAWEAIHDAMIAMLDSATAGALDVEMVVIDGASPRFESNIIAQAFMGDERVVLHRLARDVGAAAAANIGFSLSTGEHVLVLDTGAIALADAVKALRDEVRSSEASVASATTLHANGSVHNAGWVFPGERLLPHRFLDGMAATIGTPVPPTRSRGANGRAMLLAAREFAAQRGLYAVFSRELAGIDLGIRLSDGHDRHPFLPSTVKLVDPNSGSHHRDFELEELGVAAGRIGEDLVRVGPQAYDGTGLRPIRFTVDEQVPAGIVMGQRGAWPPFRRGNPVLVSTGKPSRRRWSVKIASPAAPRGDSWGDTYFASELASGLEASGQIVGVDRLEAHYRPGREVDDVVLTVRGLAAVAPQPGAINILWIISHPDLVSDAELASYDLVFAASESWAREATARTGITVRALLQATDPRVFHPGVAEPGTGHPVLFVGVPRKAMRPIVQHAIDVGAPPVIYGSGWEGLVPPELVHAPFLDRESVARHYRAAGAVLSDHWPMMAKNGFIANRVFDAAAAGAVVLSDHVDGIEEVFDGLVTIVRNVDDLRRAIEDPDARPSEEALLALSEKVRREHSFAARARQLVESVDDFETRGGLGWR